MKIQSFGETATYMHYRVDEKIDGSRRKHACRVELYVSSTGWGADMGGGEPVLVQIYTTRRRLV